MPRILAIDTSTIACSAALLVDQEIREVFEIQPQQHTRLILPMIEQLLTEAKLKPGQLDAIAFACGPGSFTGLRIAAGVVKGIAFGLSLPVISVSTLLTLAQSAYRLKGWSNIITALDARMNELYWASIQCQANAQHLIKLPEQLAKPEQAPLPSAEQWYGVGDGWLRYGELLKQRMGTQLIEVAVDLYPHAYDVALLAKELYKAGCTITAEEVSPIYIRDNMYAL